MLDYLKDLTEKAESRQTFDGSMSADSVPRTVRLSDGPARIGIVCIPPIDAFSGPHQYLDLARSFRDKRYVAALSVPGFVPGERLPADVHAVVQVEADAVLRCMDDISIVLVGTSSGGTLAYGVAGYLEKLGRPLAGVVLLDSYPWDFDSAYLQELVAPEFGKEENRRFLTESRVTAMAWYYKLFMSWRLASISTPTLLIRATDPMPGMNKDGAWRTTWTQYHYTVDVPGDHWTLLSEHAGSTAVAIDKWICDAVSGVAS